MAAAFALHEKPPALTDTSASLLPRLTNIREVFRHIGLAVAKQAMEDGVAPARSGDELESRVDKTMWTPEYHQSMSWPGADCNRSIGAMCCVMNSYGRLLNRQRIVA